MFSFSPAQTHTHRSTHTMTPPSAENWGRGTLWDVISCFLASWMLLTRAAQSSSRLPLLLCLLLNSGGRKCFHLKHKFHNTAAFSGLLEIYRNDKRTTTTSCFRSRSLFRQILQSSPPRSANTQKKKRKSVKNKVSTGVE